MAKRKKRTREHVIADLSENHFERIALLKGFSVERTAHDYGYDVTMFSYDSTGEIENGYISVQLKASDNLSYINSGSLIAFTIYKKDLDLWLKEFNPVILVVYDSVVNKAYWLYIQAYFQAIPGFSLSSIKKSLNVHIPLKNRLNKVAMEKFSKTKIALYNQLINISHTI